MTEELHEPCGWTIHCDWVTIADASDGWLHSWTVTFLSFQGPEAQDQGQSLAKCPIHLDYRHLLNVSSHGGEREGGKEGGRIKEKGGILVFPHLSLSDQSTPHVTALLSLCLTAPSPKEHRVGFNAPIGEGSPWLCS